MNWSDVLQWLQQTLGQMNNTFYPPGVQQWPRDFMGGQQTPSWNPDQLQGPPQDTFSVEDLRPQSQWDNSLMGPTFNNMEPQIPGGNFTPDQMHTTQKLHGWAFPGAGNDNSAMMPQPDSFYPYSVGKVPQFYGPNMEPDKNMPIWQQLLNNS